MNNEIDLVPIATLLFFVFVGIIRCICYIEDRKDKRQEQEYKLKLEKEIRLEERRFMQNQARQQARRISYQEAPQQAFYDNGVDYMEDTYTQQERAFRASETAHRLRELDHIMTACQMAIESGDKTIDISFTGADGMPVQTTLNLDGGETSKNFLKAVASQRLQLRDSLQRQLTTQYRGMM